MSMQSLASCRQQTTYTWTLRKPTGPPCVSISNHCRRSLVEVCHQDVCRPSMNLRLFETAKKEELTGTQLNNFLCFVFTLVAWTYAESVHHLVNCKCLAYRVFMVKECSSAAFVYAAPIQLLCYSCLECSGGREKAGKPHVMYSIFPFSSEKGIFQGYVL